MKIGAQFFTIREFTKDLDSLALSLKKVADIGYETVQISGTCEFDPQWMAEQLKANGLQCIVTHVPAAKLIETPAQVAADHEVFGCRNIGLGYYKFDETDETKTYANFLKTYKPVAEAIRANGKYFMYHNHASEFQKVEGKLVMDRIAEDFSPEELGFILDTYWVQRGGGDPAAWIEKFSGRLPVIHLKDYGYGATMEVVGEGNINFDRVFEKAEGAGVQYMMVEQDNCNGEDPFECLRRSYEYLKSCGF